jgi:hypothetical protein
VGANAKQGLRRTNSDKQKAVITLLQDPEWSQWSDRSIAKYCHVDHKTVGKIRSRLSGDFPSNKTLHLAAIERTYTTKHGTISSMNVTNIRRLTEHSQKLQSEENITPVTTLPTLNKNPKEGLNYRPGFGYQWYIRVEQSTWEKLLEYQTHFDTFTLDGAIKRLLDLASTHFGCRN